MPFSVLTIIYALPDFKARSRRGAKAHGEYNILMIIMNWNNSQVCGARPFKYLYLQLIILLTITLGYAWHCSLFLLFLAYHDRCTHFFSFVRPFFFMVPLPCLKLFLFYADVLPTINSNDSALRARSVGRTMAISIQKR